MARAHEGERSRRGRVARVYAPVDCQKPRIWLVACAASEATGAGRGVRSVSVWTRGHVLRILVGMGDEREPLAIDADDLIDAMDMDADDFIAVLDTDTGEVIVLPADNDGLDLDEELDLELERYLDIRRFESREQYRWMEIFADSLDDAPDVSRMLTVALNGRGAFRRFRDVLDGHPDLMARWYRFRAERSLACAEEWLDDEEIHYQLSVPRALREPPPERAEDQTSHEIELVHLLMLGAPAGKTELLDGRVLRTITARDAKHADQLLRRFVRQACALDGIDYRRSLVKGRESVTIGALEFTRQGTTVEVRVATSRQVLDAFSR